jgi:hypothetical protein
MLIVCSLFAIYIYDDVDRLPIHIRANAVYSDKTRFHGFCTMTLFTNSKYQVEENWCEGGRQFRGKYSISGDTIIFDDDLVNKIDSEMSNKYIIDSNKIFIYYFNTVTNKIDTIDKFEIDKIINSP